jgi:GxxExxY protein
VQAHEIQLVNYLVATGKPVGLILNFGEQKVEVKRKVKDLESD